MPSSMLVMLDTEWLGGEYLSRSDSGTERRSSHDREARAKRSKRLGHKALAAADLTQDQLADLLAVSASYIKQRLSPLEQHVHHDWHFRDILGMPEAARRLFRDELNESLGEESRPIVTEGERPLLSAIVQSHLDAAFVLRDAMAEGLLGDDEAEAVRSAAVEMITVLGALMHVSSGHRPGPARVTANRSGNGSASNGRGNDG